MTIGTDDLARITQQTKVVSSDGDRLGSIHQIYTSDTTGDPAWVTVKTGLFGSQESFVPLSDASFDGDDIRVGVTKDAVHDAPRVDSDGHLSPEEEDELYRHYGLHNPDGADVGDRDLGDDRLGDDRDNRLGDDRDGRLGGDRALGDRDDRSEGLGSDDSSAELGRDDRSERLGRDDDGGAGHDAAAAGVGAGAGAAAGSALGGGFGHDRTDDDVDTTPRHAATGDTDGRSVAAENGPEHVEHSEGTGQTGLSGQGGQGGQSDEGDREAVRPGERTTRLRRYVVTERVVQTVEELPDEDDGRG